MTAIDEANNIFARAEYICDLLDEILASRADLRGRIEAFRGKIPEYFRDCETRMKMDKQMVSLEMRLYGLTQGL